MSALERSEHAPGLALAPGARLGDDVALGANVVIYDGVVVGDGCEIADGAVLGRPPRFGPRSRTAGIDSGGELTLEDGVHVGPGAILIAGAHICAGAIVGYHAVIREQAVVGSESVIGHCAAISPLVQIGARVRIFNNTVLGTRTIVEDDVDVAANVVTTTRTWGSDDRPEQGVTLRRGCRIGANAVLLGGIEIGAGAVVGALSLVDTDVAPGAVVGGVPARALSS